MICENGKDRGTTSDGTNAASGTDSNGNMTYFSIDNKHEEN